jgi:flagellar protein FliS
MNAGTAYRQLAAHQASPVRLVILLYEQLVKDLRRALACLENDDIEGRSHEIDHALLVTCQLQGTLDKRQGGEIALALDKFYDLLRFSLVEAQISASQKILEKQIANLLILREAWTQVEAAQPAENSPVTHAGDSPSSTVPKQSAGAGWKA